MNIKLYYTNLMQEELGELDNQDREVLEEAISFEKTSRKIRRML